jgi:glutamate-ammonia-ligase adenylyltransferase
MALTRARAIAGPPPLKRRINEALRAAILNPERAGKVLEDAGAMRARMLRELPAEGPWDVKAMPGGLVEVEFIAQALQLRHAAERPEVLATTTRTALERLGKAGVLEAEEAAALIRSERLWRTVIGLIRLTHGRSKEEALPAPAEAALLRAAAPLLATDGLDAPVDLAGLRAQMRDCAGRVRAAFNRHIADLGGL